MSENNNSMAENNSQIINGRKSLIEALATSNNNRNHFTSPIHYQLYQQFNENCQKTSCKYNNEKLPNVANLADLDDTRGILRGYTSLPNKTSDSELDSFTGSDQQWSNPLVCDGARLWMRTDFKLDLNPKSDSNEEVNDNDPNNKQEQLF